MRYIEKSGIIAADSEASHTFYKYLAETTFGIEGFIAEMLEENICSLRIFMVGIIARIHKKKLRLDIKNME